MDTHLTFRQERFVFEYLKDQNASAAAARAGYTARNMASQGSELASNPAIRERVRLEMQSLLAAIRCSALELMKQRMRAAFFDPGKLLQGWEPRPLEELDEETRQVVEVNTVMRKGGPEVRVKQPDRHKALRVLEKAHERLERLNEQYYAKLEKAGEMPSLEEIERIADEEAARVVAEKHAGDFSEKAKVFSGLELETGSTALLFPENHQVFSGSEPGAGTRGMLFPEKSMVFSGSAAGRAAPPGAASRCSTMKATASC